MQATNVYVRYIFYLQAQHKCRLDAGKVAHLESNYNYTPILLVRYELLLLFLVSLSMIVDKSKP